MAGNMIYHYIPSVFPDDEAKGEKGELKAEGGEEGEEDEEGDTDDGDDVSDNGQDESEADEDNGDGDETEELPHKKPSIAPAISPSPPPPPPPPALELPKQVETNRMDIILPPDTPESPVVLNDNPLTQMEQMESVIRRISADAVMSRKERLLRERHRHKEDLYKMVSSHENQVTTTVRDNTSSSLPSSHRSLSQPISVVVPKSTPTMHKTISSKSERPSPKSMYLNPFEADFDEPLDLSKKPKMDMPKNISSNGHAPKTVGSSSLESLEKKFGSNSYMFEGISTKLQSHRSPLYSAFGGNMFTTALYATPPLSSQDPSMYKSSRTFWPRMVGNQTEAANKSYSSVSSSTPKSAIVNNKVRTHVEPSVSNRCLTQAAIMKEDSLSSPGSNHSMKHTNLTCSCRKSFHTLYDLTVHMQKTGHSPHTTKTVPETGEYPKLVRGQDMWLNQGSEQTRQILRCMQCGESFKSLPELTIHMIKTRHYTNIVGSDSAKKQHKCSAYCDKCPQDSSSNVFKCKVCNDSYGDMEGLANHMVLSGHHRKHAVKPASGGSGGGSSGAGHDGGSGTANSSDAIGDSQPVTPSTPPSLQPIAPTTPPHGAAGTVPSILPRKHRLTNGSDLSAHTDDSLSSEDAQMSSAHDMASPAIPERSTIRCENCAERIDTENFVEHVRACVKNKAQGLQNDTLDRKVSESDENDINESDSESGQKENEHVETPLLQRSPTPENNRDANVKQGDQSQSRDSPNMAVLHSTTAEPEPEGSALKAMENFIERSFTLGLPKSGLLGTKPSINGKMSTLTAAAAHHQCPLPDSTALMFEHTHNHTKYLNPDLPPPIKTEKIEVKEEVTDSPGVKSGHSTPQSTQKVDVKEEKINKKEDEKEEPVKKPLQEKYLRDESAEDAKSNGSALESLQGLVYGKAFTTEHPLDSLQKLIHNTDGLMGLPKPNGSQSIITGTATLQQHHGMPSTVILVNPIVTVVQNTHTSPAVQISISSQDVTQTTQCSPTSSSSGSASRGLPQMLLLDSELDQTGEFRCQACNRTFASKGSYRYHLSRCHLSSVKKYGIKEAFNMSPYVYLPLDHTAKFTKYYQMANELANKGK